jgi:ferritin
MCRKPLLPDTKIGLCLRFSADKLVANPTSFAAMLPPPAVLKALNAQIKNELQAHYNYLGMSAFFERTPYLGFATWMRMQASEEYGHAIKLYDFLRSRNAPIELSAIEAPKMDFGKNPTEVFEISLKQEQGVTQQINDLYELALTQKDFATLQFLTWFLQEQVEEENTVSDIIDRLRLAGDNSAGLLRLDEEAGRRAAAAGAKPK